jgi:hypothetical protein
MSLYRCFVSLHLTNWFNGRKSGRNLETSKEAMNFILKESSEQKILSFLDASGT